MRESAAKDRFMRKQNIQTETQSVPKTVPKRNKTDCGPRIASSILSTVAPKFPELESL